MTPEELDKFLASGGKKSLEEIENDLDKVKGWKFTYWKHYKGDIYQVIGFATECNSNDLMILYKKMATGWDHLTFTRPVSEWQSESRTGEPRFVQV